MKKLLLLLPVMLFMAAGCNPIADSQLNATSATTANAPVKHVTGVDAVVNDLDKSIKSEQSLQTQSDSDIVTSDRGVVTSTSDGVSNEF